MSSTGCSGADVKLCVRNLQAHGVQGATAGRALDAEGEWDVLVADEPKRNNETSRTIAKHQHPGDQGPKKDVVEYSFP